ncbi:hypothetical protein Y1Q_0018292 [Alligator mississippiensis]|uniref:PEA3-type ETS-domain transcription factor N-terminal domain-containing protein n=1 Tax=Alligator mississippiensis TaxID=8496 RepID=A0A151PBR7_ALLMI|nr:hypothetical protein Y1Q_0018292 [Alligator mississippiensis]
MDGRMKGYLDQQVPYTFTHKPLGNGTLTGARRRPMDPGLPPPQDSEDLFQDLSQLQETWLTEALPTSGLV